jgi:acetyl esterase/lipase
MGVGVNYRLAPQVTWKEQLADVLAALDFVRAQQVDLKRIALWGTSAGAHLALLAAAQRPDQIRCVLTIGAATHPPDLPRDMTQEAFPSLDDPTASPRLSCTQLPTTMMIHGAQDPIIPVTQHHEFVRAHPQVESIVVKDGDHHVRWPPLSGLQTRRRAVNWVIEQLDIPHVGSKWRRRRKGK